MLRLTPSVQRNAGLVLALLGLVLLPSFAFSQGWELKVCSDPNNLPYSNEAEEGFENRIAEILADEMGAELSYTWFPQRMLLSREVFREGGCDLIIGVNDGHPQFLTTLPYYRSSFVFVYPEEGGLEITSLDDPALAELKIGVQVPVGGGANVTPPGQALADRGLAANLVGYSIAGDYESDTPLSPIIDAVVSGKVDLAVAWGPIAGYFAQQQDMPLTVIPVTPEIVPPFLPMVFGISAGVRQGDIDFSELLDRALVARWDEISGVLEEYGVPLLPLPKPVVETGN